MNHKAGDTAEKMFTIAEAAKAEQEFIGDQRLLQAVVTLMGNERIIWHDTMKGIANNINDERIAEWGDAFWEEYDALGKLELNSKVRALKRLSKWFALLGEAFNYVESHKEENSHERD